MRPENKKTAIRLLLNTVVLMALYFTAAYLEFRPILWIYIGAGAALGIFYVIYNRGFVGKNATPDMLSDTLTAAEKEEYLADCRRRMEKSKWVLTILIPILLTICADVIYLFIFPKIEALFR